jgi:hypothetical protein
MIEAIARLRRIADETETAARAPGLDRSTRSDMIDLAAKWQWLAGEAARLCAKGNELNGHAACAHCMEHCLFTDHPVNAPAAVA